MGYDLHLTREPDEGWDAWTSANAPPDLLRRIEEAENHEDYDLVFELEDELEALVKPKKAEAGFTIAVDEWIAAVESVPGARIAGKNPCWTNPKTGDVVTIRNSENSVEVQDRNGDWSFGIHYSEGRITFSGHAWEADEPIAAIACRLAARLGAKS